MRRPLSILLVIFAVAFVGLAHGDVLLDEGFEGSTSLPSGWTQTQLSGSATWNIQTGGWTGGTWPNTAHSGVYNATLSKASTNNNETRLITPVFWSAGRTGLSLTFWHYQAVWTGQGQDELRVLYSSDGGTNWSQLAYYNASVTAWTLRTLSLPTPSPSSRIAFEGNAKYGIGLSIDDIQVTGNAATEVSVVATDKYASEEGQDTGTFTITRSGVTNAEMTVNFVMSGTATETADYTLSHAGQVIFAPGEASVQVTLTPVDDSVKDEFDLDNDGSEAAILSITPDPQYYGIATGTATVNIRDNDFSGLQVLIIGSTHDSSERFGGTSAAFSPTAMATQLASILDAATSNANVVTIERYATATSALAQSHYAFNLASWFHWPYPSGADSNRWANLRGEAGVDWDYVILIPDPYTIEKMPGLYSYGVGQIADEVAKGSAETILLMPWPNGSGSSVAHYEEMVYRAGNSGGFKVAPAGLAWNSAGNPTGNNAAYLAAATIYSSIYGLNAKDTGYSYSPSSLADTALSTVASAAAAPHYTGDITFQNPFLFRKDTKRKIYWSSHGTSTEAGFNAKIGPAIARCKVGYESYTPWNRNWTDWTNNGGDTYWTEWSTNWPTPIAWNLGRDPLTSEPYKGYLINPTYWTFAFPFYYQSSTWFQSVEDANNHYVGQMFGNDFDMAKRMLTEGNSGRGLPLRTLWAQFHKEFPAERPQRDNSGPHLSYYEDEAVATYIYTLYSGRCPLDTPPASPETDANWTARRIGYETAWRMGRCQTRAPGFKVMPTAWNASNVTPTVSQSLSVQFILAPTSDVTVVISSDDNSIGRVTPSIMTFTPQNYSDAQTVTVSGVTGSAGAHPFNITVTTASGDEVYNGLSDQWDFVNTRSAGPAPEEIRILGNGNTIASGDSTPDLADGTDFDVVMTSTSMTFTIENMSPSVTLDLTSDPRVTLSGSGDFSLSQDAATAVGPSSSTTFTILYSPGTAGSHSGTVTVASDDAGIPSYSFAIRGTRASAPTAGTPSALISGSTRATLSGIVSGGGLADAWICWGNEDGGSSSTGSWDNVAPVGSMYQDDAFSTFASNLVFGIIYECRIYTTNIFGEDWSDLTTFALSNSEIVGSVNWDFETGDLSGWTNVGTAVSTDTLYRNGNQPMSGTGMTGKQGTYYVDGYRSNNEGNSDSFTGIIETEDTYVLGAGAHLTMLSGGGTFSWSGTPDSPGTLAGVALEREVSPGVWENVIFQTGGNNDLIARDHDLSVYAGETVRLRVYDTTTGGWGWTGVDDITLTSVSMGNGASVTNTEVQNITGGSGDVSGVLEAHNSVFDLYLYWSQVSNATAAAWEGDGTAQSIYIGSYTNITSHSVTQSISSLAGSTVYYCTFMASNEVTNLWANPSLQFATHGTNLYSLVYQAGSSGSLSGSTNQSVIEMSSGSAVTAVPDSGYRFASWSDGSIQNPRTDTLITSNITVTANFELDLIRVENAGASPSNTTSALLSGQLTGGTSGFAWICWGNSDPGTGSTGDWDNVISIGPVTESTPFSTVVNTLATNETYWYRCYVSNAADTAWSTEAESFSGTPAGGGATWTPAELPLTAWYDAADTGTILTNDAVDRVSQWSDKSGYARHATNSAASSQPTYEAAGFRGFPAVSCAGAGQILNLELPTPSTQVVFVVTGVSSSAFVTVFVSSGGSMIPMANDGSGSAPFRVSGVGDIGGAQGLDLFVNGDTNAVTSTRGGMYGALVQSNTNGVLAKFADLPLLTATAFNQMGGNISAWLARNRYSEIVVVDASTQIEDQQRIEGYLAHKWGMADDLHVDHPYRYTVPGGAARIENRAATSIAETSAVLNAALNSPGTNSDVYVHWGTSDGGSNPVAWASTAYIDAYSDIITNVSYSLGGLIRGQTYFYTFSASNGDGYVWASPSWYFTPPAGAVLTTNHLIPHVWLDTVLTNTISDYEAEVDDDPDGDGFTTWQEYWSGTDPNAADSHLKIDAVRFDGTNVEIEWQHSQVSAGIPPITVLASTNLASGPWFRAGDKAPSNGTNRWSEASFQRLFYKLAVTNAP